jgi:hypothetical protein
LRWLIASSVILAGAGPAWTGQPAVEPQAHQAAKAAGPAPKLVEYGPKGLDVRRRRWLRTGFSPVIATS